MAKASKAVKVQLSRGELINARQLAEYWGVSYRSICWAAGDGLIPGCLDERGPNREFVFDTAITLKEWVPPQIQRFMAATKTGVVSADRLAILHQVVTPEDWVLIVKKAVNMAIAGDYRARNWIGNYLMGTPVKRIEAVIDQTVRIEGSGEDARAQAILALLSEVKKREESKIVDVEVVDATSGTTE